MAAKSHDEGDEKSIVRDGDVQARAPGMRQEVVDKDERRFERVGEAGQGWGARCEVIEDRIVPAKSPCTPGEIRVSDEDAGIAEVSIVDDRDFLG